MLYQISALQNYSKICTVCASLPYIKVSVPVVDVTDFARDFELSDRARANNSADTVAVHYCLSPCISDTSRTIRYGVRTFVHIWSIYSLRTSTCACYFAVPVHIRHYFLPYQSICGITLTKPVHMRHYFSSYKYICGSSVHFPLICSIIFDIPVHNRHYFSRTSTYAPLY